MAPSIGLPKIKYGEEKEDLPLDREAGIVGQKVEKKDEIRDRKGHLEYLVYEEVEGRRKAIEL